MEIMEMKHQGITDGRLLDKEDLLKRYIAFPNPIPCWAPLPPGTDLPEIYRMQVRAIFETMVLLKKKAYLCVEIEIPLVIDQAELSILKEEIAAVHREVSQEAGMELEYLLGTMLELPRACACGGRIGGGCGILLIRHQ